MRSFAMIRGKIPLIAGAVLLAQALAACGARPTSSDLPPRAADLGTKDLSAEESATQKRWDDLANALAIPNNRAKTSEELVAQLGTPSAFLTDPAKAAAYQALLGQIAAKHVATAFATRCAGIVGVRRLAAAHSRSLITGEVTPLPGADLYLMKFKLQKSAAGDAEDQTRAGLLIVPNSQAAAQSSPILAYGHGGDHGLTYEELAVHFGALQATHIIVAPPFPGEVLCLGAFDDATRTCADAPLAAALGTSVPYDNDVDELLGMQDCVVRASLIDVAGAADPTKGGLPMPVLDASGVATTQTLNGAVGTMVRRHTGGTFVGLPISLVSGSSRGGLVANIALAKTGAILKTWAADQSAPTKTLGAAYLRPSLFSCSMTNYPPSTLTAGEFRIGMELVAKGQAKNTSFYGLPSFAQLNLLLEDYRRGTMTAEQTAVLIAQRDATLSGPFVIAALRNWSKANLGVSSGGKGVLAIDHGVLDRVVPFSQTKLAFNILLGIGANPGIVSDTDPNLAPGVTLFARAFMPAAKYVGPDGKLTSAYFQHGDVAFADGTSVMPTDFLSPAISGRAFADAALEARANQLATALGKDVQFARFLILTGQTSLTADGKALDDAKNLIGLPPDTVFASVRASLCESALAP